MQTEVANTQRVQMLRVAASTVERRSRLLWRMACAGVEMGGNDGACVIALHVCRREVALLATIMLLATCYALISNAMRIFKSTRRLLHCTRFILDGLAIIWHPLPLPSPANGPGCLSWLSAPTVVTTPS